jgi:dihydrodipicolinate synthase/N-acetylneuraminate lyase
MKDASVDDLIAHCAAVAEIIPLFGFYLQPAVGGRLLPVEFWRRFARIENVVAIKIAPFNRYQTLDVIRGVAESGRANEIELYTGNDDNIVADLLTTYRIGALTLRIAGGLLGHWAFWTKKAGELLAECHRIVESGAPVPQELLTRAVQITDSNAAAFDAANNFAGCIPGIHAILARQGLLEGTWTLDPGETLSPGQANEIDRVRAAYPHLSDDEFVAEHLDEWLG